MECMRRIDVVPMLQDMFPSEGIRIAATNREIDPNAEMFESEKSVLALLRTPRPMRDIMSRAKMPAFDVYEALKLLKEKGLVVLEADAPTSAETSRHTSAHRARRQLGNPLVMAACLVLFAVCAFAGAWRDADRAAALSHNGIVASGAANRARVEYHVRWLIEAYRARTGFYPEDLDELVKAGIADRSTLSLATSMDLRYKLTSDRQAYTLL
jgi:hypothetical protein